jgi:hypothetical protein
VTLAYVFWHQPRSGANRAEYEDALLRFHARLRDVRVPGSLGSTTARIPTVPWLPGGGYEDWYYVEDFTALGALNAGAIDAAHGATHDAVAGLAGPGAGGLYRLVSGPRDSPSDRHVWLAHAAEIDGSLWQRQMVLGPAPEFCAVAESGPDVADALVVAVTTLR